MALTAKQKKFADGWAKTFNGTQAAIDAGYKERSAASIASENLRKPEIQAYIHARMREQAASPEETLAFMTSVMRGQVKDQFGLDASLADRLRACEGLMKRHEKMQEADKQADMEDLAPLAEMLRP